MMITKENLEDYFHQFVGKYKRLTRQFERDVPSFKSHTEARVWFKSLFGDDFMLVDTQMIDGEKLWRYALVIDRPAWEEGQEAMEADGMVNGMDFLMSSHSVEIMDSGSVHIVF